MLSNAKGRSHPPSFTHLRRLTDDTGLLEHALGRTPRRQEGYTTDDNARSLWVVTEWLRDVPGSEVSDADRALLLDLASIYLSFMLWQQKEDGWWHNNVAYDRSPEKETVSYDCQGRSIWACVAAWVGLPDSHRDAAAAMFECAMPTFSRIASLRGKAYTLSACAYALESERLGLISFKPGWREQLKSHVVRLQEELIDKFTRNSDEAWRWFEPVMSYGNGVLPWALLRAYRVTHAPEALEIGLDSLSSLQAAMTAEQGWFRPIGNSGWRSREGSSKWDQQPLEIFKLALALEEGAAALEEAGKQGVTLLLAYEQGADSRLGSAAGRTQGGERGSGGFRSAGSIRAPEVGIALAVRSETEDGLSGAGTDSQAQVGRGSGAGAERIFGSGSGEGSGAERGLGSRSVQGSGAERGLGGGSDERGGAGTERSFGSGSGAGPERSFGSESGAGRERSLGGGSGEGRGAGPVRSFGSDSGAGPERSLGGELGAKHPEDAHAIEVADYAAQLRAARNRCLDWFFGANDLGAIMADERDGSGCDGLQEDGPNVNCGAESTISYLMTAAMCRQ